MPYTIKDYLRVPYVDGGRDMLGFDCWGMTRHRLHHHYGHPLFESFGHINPDDKPTLTTAYKQIVDEFSVCNPKPGAVACGFKLNCLVHMGTCEVIDGELRVLHTSRKNGASHIKVADFKRLFIGVKFYEYKG